MIVVSRTQTTAEIIDNGITRHIHLERDGVWRWRSPVLGKNGQSKHVFEYEFD